MDLENWSVEKRIVFHIMVGQILDPIYRVDYLKVYAQMYGIAHGMIELHLKYLPDDEEINTCQEDSNFEELLLRCNMALEFDYHVRQALKIADSDTSIIAEFIDKITAILKAVSKINDKGAIKLCNNLFDDDSKVKERESKDILSLLLSSPDVVIDTYNRITIEREDLEYLNVSVIEKYGTRQMNFCTEDILDLGYKSGYKLTTKGIYKKHSRPEDKELGAILINFWNFVFQAQGDFNACNIFDTYETSIFVIISLTKASVNGKLKFLYSNNCAFVAEEIRKIIRNMILILLKAIPMIELIYSYPIIKDLQKLQTIAIKAPYRLPSFAPVIDALKAKEKESALKLRQRGDFGTSPHFPLI